MRFSVIHIRIAIVALNLAMTAVVGLQTYFGVFHAPKYSTPSFVDPATLRTGQGDRNPDGSALSVAMTGAARLLVPPPVPPPPPPVDATAKKEAVEVGPDGSGELPPGPLENTWEYVQCFVVPSDRYRSQATLHKKDPAAASLPGVPGKKAVQKISSRTARPTVAGRSTRLPIPGAAAQGDSKTLRVQDIWKDDDQGFWIRVIDITEVHFIYEEKSQKGRRFALKRTKLDIGDGSKLSGQKDEGEGENPPDKKPMFSLTPPNRDKNFETWGEFEGIAASPATSATLPGATQPGAVRPGGTGPAASPKRPLSQEEQVKQAGEAMKSLQSNKEYLKVPKEKRDELEKLLGPAGKK